MSECYEKVWLWTERKASTFLQAISERRENINISAMNDNGILAIKIIRGTVHGDEFLEFIER